MTVMNIEKLVNRLDNTSQQALEAALGVVSANSQRSVEIVHWLYQLLQSTDHVWQSCLSQFQINVPHLKAVLQKKMLCYEQLPGAIPTLSQSIIDMTCEAWLVASLECNLSSVSPMFLFLAMLSDPMVRQELSRLIPELKLLDVNALRSWCIAQGKEQATLYIDDGKSFDNINSANHQNTEALDKFTTDLTAQAKNKELDPVIGRTSEIQQMIDVLLRRKQNNPILIGEPGVGKTACVEGLAQRIVAGTVPSSLQNIRLLALDLTAMQAGASVKGEFEKRLKQLIHEVQNSETPIILFIDEAHQLIGAGGQQGTGDAANILKPALARGELRTIAATTWQEYKKYFTKDSALVRRFQPVTVAEPTPDVAIDMLRNTVDKLQKHHGIIIEDAAVQAAVHLSHQYLSERKLPDKAMSLLDTACARAVSPRQGICFDVIAKDAEIANLQLAILSISQDENVPNAKETIQQLKSDCAQLEKERAEIIQHQQEEKALIAKLDELIKQKEDHKDFAKQKKSLLKQLQLLQKNNVLMPFTINRRMVAQVLSSWTGIPISNMLTQAQTKVMALEDYCNQHIYGQEKAIHDMTQALITSSARIAKPNKPLGVFLLVGPSGVGKTETALKIAEQLFGSKDKLTVINMSAFKESHKVSTLTGSPPGYVGYGEGGVLTEAIRREPHSLILLDEMEKAHPSVQDIFYQMLDRGIIRDSEGRDIDCRQTVIMMTSNAADQFITQHAKAIAEDDANIQQNLQQTLEKYFKPAFLGRVIVVPYMPLDDKMVEQIIRYQLDALGSRIKEQHHLEMSYQPEVVLSIKAQCHAMQTGARQISHIIDKSIAPPLARLLLARKVSTRKSVKQTLQLDVQNGQYSVSWLSK